tara:strand:- start:704 stop:862 length:159 start_codon:yes stop_codon:yes gene_type:complete
MAWNEYSLSKKKFAVDKDFHARNKHTINKVIVRRELKECFAIKMSVSSPPYP